jgi:hypothetical protein
MSDRGVNVSEPSGAMPGRNSMSWLTGDSASGGYVKYDSLESQRSEEETSWRGSDVGSRLLVCMAESGSRGVCPEEDRLQRDDVPFVTEDNRRRTELPIHGGRSGKVNSASLFRLTCVFQKCVPR